MLLFFQYYTHCTILEWFVLCCERTDGEVASSYTLMSRDVIKKGGSSVESDEGAHYDSS